jgi:hypothetical protein
LPHLLPWPSLAWPLVYRFLPGKDADSCIWDIMVFLPWSGERPPSCETIECGPNDPLVDLTCFSGFNQNSKSFGGLALILHQDAVQLPLVQSGMKNLPNGELVISEYQEMRIRHYHQTLADTIARQDLKPDPWLP